MIGYSIGEEGTILPAWDNPLCPARKISLKATNPFLIIYSDIFWVASHRSTTQFYLSCFIFKMYRKSLKKAAMYLSKIILVNPSFQSDPLLRFDRHNLFDDFHNISHFPDWNHHLLPFAKSQCTKTLNGLNENNIMTS